MGAKEAKALLALLQRIIDDNPKASPETWSAQFVCEAMADPDLRNVPADDVMAVWLKELEAKRSSPRGSSQGEDRHG